MTVRDLDTVALLLADDPEAWRAFARRELQFMEWVCTRTLERSGRPFSAQDVAEDVARAMLKLLDRDRRLLKRFDGRSRLSTYVGIVARSTSLERLRAEGRRPRPAGPGIHEAVSSPAHPLDALVLEEIRQGVRGAMGALPERERQALEAFYDRGLTYPLVAHSLGVSVQEVKSLLASARARLAFVLKES